MAEKAEKSAKKTVKTTPDIVESTYGIDELVAANSAFNTHKAIIKVALQRSGKTRFTLDESKEIVKEFKNKEVK